MTEIKGPGDVLKQTLKHTLTFLPEQETVC